MDLERLTDQLARIPGVVAVALGGSRARGEAQPDSDWDFGLYYRGVIDPQDIRRLGFEGEVVSPGAWGRIVNGGAWLRIDGERVDLLYRDLELVEHWLGEAEHGRFEVDLVAGHIAGLPTYVLAGELAINEVLRGALPRPAFPDRLRETAPPWWYGNAAFALHGADARAARGDVTACAGLLAKAAIAVAHARLAKRGEWALNEKGITRRAGLDAVDGLLAGPGCTPEDLMRTVRGVRDVLGIAPPAGLKLDRAAAL